MKQTSTLVLDDLICYIYGELPKEERRSLESLLDIDDDLYETYNKLADAKDLLSKVAIKPKSSTIDSILNYSREGLTV